jgi:hypothetical protein
LGLFIGEAVARGLHDLVALDDGEGKAGEVVGLEEIVDEGID